MKIVDGVVLPSSYQRVEYIQSSGTQYIDTGYVPQSNFKYRLVFELTSFYISGQSFAFLFSSYVSGNRYCIQSRSNQFYIQVGSGTSQTPAASLNTRYDFTCDATNYTLNGVTASTGGSYISGNTYSFQIFADKRYNANTNACMKLYESQVWEGNNLVRYLVPCYRKSDNEIGLYDVINKHFYTNLGTGEFTKGRNIYSVFKVKLDKDNYKRLDYIQSSGTQYLDINYVCKKQNTIIELDMAWTGTNVGAFETFIGFMYSTSQVTPRIGLHKYSSVLMFGANDTITSSTAPVSNERFVYKGDFTSGNQRVYKNGTLLANRATTYDFSTNTCPTYMFARYCPSSMNYASMRCYECKIWEGTELVKHLLPMKNIVTNEIGMYDLISGEFYTNRGTGNFSYGEIELYNLPKGYQRVEYIQSTGTQRIKTNITPTSKYKIEEEFAITDRSVTSCIWCARGNTTGTNSTTAFNIANSQLRCDYGVSASMINIGTLNANQKYKLTMNAEKWYLDDTLKTTMSTATFTSGGALSLFYSYYGGQDANVGNYAKMKLYSFKVWNASGELVGCFVPCYETTNGTIGLYNIVEGQFYTNVGTGTFGKGGDIIERVVNAQKMSPKTTLLPPEYQQVEYISNSNGAQFLEIPFVPNYTKGFKFEFGMTPTSTGKRYCLISNYNVGSQQLSLELSADNKARLWLNNGSLNVFSTNTFSTSAKNTLTYEFRSNVWKIILNNTTATGSYSVTGASSTPSMYLFLDKAKRTSTFPTPIKIYYCIISQEDKEVYHLVPCYKKSDNTIGMFDIIGKNFYPNGGTGSFTKGNNEVNII